MQTTENQKRFSEFYGLANRIIEVADKDTLADAARPLALHIARYQSEYGKLSMVGTVELLHSDTVTDEQLGAMADGMSSRLMGRPKTASPYIGHATGAVAIP